MKIASNGGIGNRLRTMIGYAGVSIITGRAMPQFVWLDTEHAPANNGVFGIRGADIVDAKEADDETVIVPGTIDIPLLYRTYSLPNPSFNEVLAVYSLITFSFEVQAKAFACHPLALHIRMTDWGNEDTFQRFARYLVKSSPAFPFYLACDDQATYDRLADKFDVVNYSTFTDIPGSRRKTSIFDAAVDMLVCVNAGTFVGTKGSSYSAMIVHLRLAQGSRNYVLL